MGLQVIDQTVQTSAGPEAVYALLADGATWPTWSPLGSFELLEPGDGTPEGVGRCGSSRRAGTGAASE